jgi:hypothetical protein
MTSVFAQYIPVAYPHQYTATLAVHRLAGGIPSDPKVAEGWLKTKLVGDRDDLIRQAVAETMAERGITAEQAAAEVDLLKHLNGFKRAGCPECPNPTTVSDPNCRGKHELYIEGRQAKAMIKEASNVRWPWPLYNWTINGLRTSGSVKGEGKGKSTMSYIAEHVFVQDDRILLGVHEPDEVEQRFVHTWRGSGIQYEEIIREATVRITVATDHDLTAEQWGLLWLTAEQIGIGSSRSQGFGRFEVIGWEPVKLGGRK